MQRSSERSTERERGSAEPDRDNIFRWRDRQYFGPKRWLETALRDPAWQEGDKEGGKKEGVAQVGPSPLWLGDELEFWPERQVIHPIRGLKSESRYFTQGGSGLRFSCIAALHSELLAVSSTGYLYQVAHIKCF